MYWVVLQGPFEPASIKGEVKKKHIFFGWNFLASQPT
jgi:hypothetical protein